MFKFQFGQTSDDSPGKKCANRENKERKSCAAFISIKDAEAMSSAKIVDVVNLCGSEVRFQKSTATVPESLSPTGADVVPGIYEGGFKLWECAEDLVSHIHNHLREAFNQASVLELGAGHALPAILAAKCGARRVDIHDYNEEVLHGVSMPNVKMNLPDDRSTDVRYVMGHWADVPGVVGESTYDFILSSDTVYAAAQLDDLAECVLRVLKLGGVALFAGKTYYFGVGGGMKAFCAAVEKVAASMNVTVSIENVSVSRDGKSNVREIASIQKS